MLQQLRKLLRDWLLLPPTPGPIYVVNVRNLMSALLGTTLALPPVTVRDVAVRKLLVQVAGSPDVNVDIKPGDQTYEVVAGDGIAVHVELVDVDADGNASTPSVLDFTSKDTVAPPQPGSLHTTTIREIDNEAVSDTTGTATT